MNQQVSIEVFKTNIRRKQDAKAIMNLLSSQFPTCRCTFDLDDRDRILRVEGVDFIADRFIQMVLKAGFHCEILD